MGNPPAPLPFRRVGELQGASDVSGWLTIDRKHLAGFAFSTYLTADALGRCDLHRRRAQPCRDIGQYGSVSSRRRAAPGTPSGQNGTNAMPRASHSVRTSRDRWSATLKRFCTQTISVCATARSRCRREMLLSPIRRHRRGRPHR
jgi:hypothetical protein